MGHSELRDPRLAGVQFTHVRFSPDLSVCRVWYLPGASGPSPTAASLRHAAGYMRKRLGESFRLRRQPELRFVLDETQTRGDALAGLIEDAVRSDDRARAGSAAAGPAAQSQAAGAATAADSRPDKPAAD